MKLFLLLGAACVALVLPCFGQAPPPNDNFANRTVLTGSSVAFSGTLAGATIEPNEALGGDFTNDFYETESAWWTWTAPRTSLVTVERTGAGAGTNLNGYFRDGMAIYDTTNLSTGSIPVAEFALDVSILCDAVTFSATEGSSYEIQMVGESSTAYQFQLTASDSPLILQGPRNLTVSSNASTLFTVVAEGYRPLNYQWQFAGSNLPGQTAPMLALTNIGGTQEGSYTVVVTNIGGAVTSAPAVLAVSSSIVPPSLTAIAGPLGQFGFRLTGEVGCNYRIESSVDLIDWTNDFSFPKNFYPSSQFAGDEDRPVTTSLVFNTNGSSVFIVSNAAPGVFFRALRYTSANEICINNLRQIRFAKALWLRDDTLTNGQWLFDTPEGEADLAPYFLNGKLPICPDDTNSSWYTSYSTGVENCATTPICLIDYSGQVTGHVLEEPQ